MTSPHRIPEHRFDEHLNLFYSYDSKGQDNAEGRLQLENNVTRAFLVCLRHLRPATQERFLRDLLGSKAGAGLRVDDTEDARLRFDLQSVEPKEALTFIQREDASRVLLTIGSFATKLTKEDFADNSLAEELKDLERRVSKMSKADKHKLRDLLRDFLSSDVTTRAPRSRSSLQRLVGDFGSEGSSMDRGRLEFLMEIVLQGSMPDAWIFNGSYSILIEVKIGTNAITKPQIFRHLIHKGGFNLNSDEVLGGDRCDKYWLVNKTWADVIAQMERLDKLKKAERTIVSEFRRYLSMSGANLDLSRLLDDEGNYDRHEARTQLPLLLEELDRRMAGEGSTPEKFPLTRARRPLAGHLWDYYGRKEENKGGRPEQAGQSTRATARQDPHYSVYLDADGAGIALTTKRTALMKELLGHEGLRRVLLEKLANPSPVDLPLYSIALKNYRLIDRQIGAMKGENMRTFTFLVNLSELNGRKPREVETLLERMQEFLPLAKQAELILMVPYPNLKKIRKDSQTPQFRELCKGLLEDPKNLLTKFVEFINETKDIYASLVGRANDSSPKE